MQLMMKKKMHKKNYLISIYLMRHCAIFFSVAKVLYKNKIYIRHLAKEVFGNDIIQVIFQDANLIEDKDSKIKIVAF